MKVRFLCAEYCLKYTSSLLLLRVNSAQFQSSLADHGFVHCSCLPAGCIFLTEPRSTRNPLHPPPVGQPPRTNDRDLHVCMHACMHTYVCVCACMCMPVCMCIYIYIYSCNYFCAAHRNTFTNWFSLHINRLTLMFLYIFYSTA